MAVIVTVPVLVVAPAAIVSVALALSAKSELVAGDTGVAETVIVVAALDARFRLAVTVVVPPFSPTEAGDKARVTVGGSSSSVMVSVTSAGSVMPCVLDASPWIVMVLSGASTSLLTAVIVTVPVLVVAPAAIVSVVLELSA